MVRFWLRAGLRLYLLPLVGWVRRWVLVLAGRPRCRWGCPLAVPVLPRPVLVELVQPVPAGRVAGFR